MTVIQSIQNRIYDVRGQRVMLDFDLAGLYQVETKALNQAVKRNAKRFPADFMFRLTQTEWEAMRSQIVTTSQSIGGVNLVATQGKRNIGATPYAFTEQGLAMLSGILNSDRAISMNISIMRAFVEIRRLVLNNADVAAQLYQLQQRLGEHDVQLNSIYDAMENLLDEKAAGRKWEDRNRIRFKQQH